MFCWCESLLTLGPSRQWIDPEHCLISSGSKLPKTTFAGYRAHTHLRTVETVFGLQTDKWTLEEGPGVLDPYTSLSSACESEDVRCFNFR